MFLSVLVADQKRFSQWEFGLKSDARNFVFAPSGQGFFPSNVPARRHSAGPERSLSKYVEARTKWIAYTRESKAKEKRGQV